MEDLRYPIGKFKREKNATEVQIKEWLDQIEETPAKIREAVAGLSDKQLDTAYRPEGWTVRQVVHHIADSHANSYMRFKLALTEDEPTIKPYFEDRWAELVDTRSAPLELSLALLDPLHKRWMLLLRSLSSEDLNRKFNHPEIGTISLKTNINLYAWHGRHHVAHITSLRKRNGW